MKNSQKWLKVTRLASSVYSTIFFDKTMYLILFLFCLLFFGPFVYVTIVEYLGLHEAVGWIGTLGTIAAFTCAVFYVGKEIDDNGF